MTARDVAPGEIRGEIASVLRSGRQIAGALVCVVSLSLIIVVSAVISGPPHSKLGMALEAGFPFVLSLLTTACVVDARAKFTEIRADLARQLQDQIALAHRLQAEREREVAELERAALGHVLYRLLGSDGELLYIGITNDPNERFRKHRADKHWWSQVANVRLEYLTSRAELEAIERLAIVREHPRYNVIHKQVLR